MNQHHDRSSRFPQAPILPPNSECVAMYTVKAGDTLYSISQCYGVSVARLMQVNRIMNPYCLKIGQQICIPGQVQEEFICDGMLYTLIEGDTLYSIAQRFHVPLDVLLTNNPGLDPYNLWVGMKICIPTLSENVPHKMAQPMGVVPTVAAPAIPSAVEMPECDGQLYTLREGDNFYVLAKRYNVNLLDLLSANPNMDPYHLEVGSRICIPMPQAIEPPLMPVPVPMPVPMPMQPQTMPTPMTMPQQLTMPPQIPIPQQMTMPPQMTIPTNMNMSGCSGLIHTVCSGDSLYMISKKYHISLDDLIKANPNLDPYNLRVGMKLCVPVPRHTPAAPMDEMMPENYYIHIGDTFDQLCNRFNVMPHNMMKANPSMTVKDFSVPGTKVCIPN